jgi:Ion channel
VVFASAYRIADGLSVVALFHGPAGPIRVSYSDALHFSLATLSTVGYGDIQPYDDGIRVLASLQVVAGQLLLLFGFAEIMRARPGPKDDGEEPRRRRRHEEPGPPA